MAEDNVPSPKTGYVFDFDENINPFCSKSKLSHSPSSSVRYEDNQNIISTTLTNTSYTVEESSGKSMASLTTPKRKQANNISVLCNQSKSFERSSMLQDCKVFSISHNEITEGKTLDVSGPENYKNMVDASHIENGTHQNIHNNVLITERNICAVHKRHSEGDMKVEDLEGAVSSDTDNRDKVLDFKDFGDFSSNTLGSTSNQSEAGPDVAQFTEEEFKSAAEFFKDPSAFEFLQKAGNSSVLQESTLARFSLYVKFDPLLKSDSPAKHQSGTRRGDTGVQNKCLADQLVNNQLEQSPPANHIKVNTDRNDQTPIEMVGNMARPLGSGKLIDFSPSPRKNDSSSPGAKQFDNGPPYQLKDTKLFTEEELNQALKIQELLYQEKLIKKDKEWNEKLKAYEKDKQHLKTQSHAHRQASAVSRFVVSELTKMFSTWKEQKEQERIEMTATNQKLIKERDQALEDLQNVETAFADLHRRYEKAKGVLEGYKQNEDKLREQCAELQNKIKQQEQMYDMLRLRTEEKLESANTELETARKGVEAEVVILKAQVKKGEMKITSLERNLEQKNKECSELSSICDELIAKVGKT